tara:strand:+ start:1787 stop:2605 length:819 start_codon:yes stop_codon:yes gene_type:complete
METKTIAEAGINHNGSVDISKKLVDAAVVAGCDYIKWQKRSPDTCVPEGQKLKPKSTPWGDMTYIEYKHRIEFGEQEYDEIFSYCDGRIKTFASVWDKDSVDFMRKYTDIAKIPSALITNIDLCKYARSNFDQLLISTGMSTEEEIETCINSCNPDVIFHTNSTYPSPVGELNLNYIKWLEKKYPNKEIGYSGHEYGLVTTFAAVAIGATWVERHLTLDRTMWGSDHLASVEPQGLIKLVKGIRDIESSMSQPQASRALLDGEKVKRRDLRK